MLEKEHFMKFRKIPEAMQGLRKVYNFGSRRSKVKKLSGGD